MKPAVMSSKEISNRYYKPGSSSLQRLPTVGFDLLYDHQRNPIIPWLPPWNRADACLHFPLEKTAPAQEKESHS
jgi:hypothetical protein